MAYYIVVQMELVIEFPKLCLKLLKAVESWIQSCVKLDQLLCFNIGI